MSNIAFRLGTLGLLILVGKVEQAVGDTDEKEQTDDRDEPEQPVVIGREGRCGFWKPSEFLGLVTQQREGGR